MEQTLAALRESMTVVQMVAYWVALLAGERAVPLVVS